MAFNTGNPLGSTDPRDFSDNSENLDRAVNNASSATWTDRFGNTRTSLAGQIGYIGTGVDGAIEDYAAGQELTTFSTIIRYSGEFYRPAASATLPYTTTATTPDVDSNLVAVGDAVLRQDLANNASLSGSDLVAHTGTADTVTEALDKRTIYIESIAESIQDIDPSTLTDNEEISVKGWHSGTERGGGRFFWSSSTAKSAHNGINVISLTVPKVSAQAGADAAARRDNYLAGTGETDGAGTGCFIREEEGQLSILVAGAYATGTAGQEDTGAHNAMKAAFPGGIICLPAGNYRGNFVIDANTKILGAGRFRTSLFADSAASPVALMATETFIDSYYLALARLTIDGESTATVGIRIGESAVPLDTATYADLSDVEVKSCADNIEVINCVGLDAENVYSHSASGSAFSCPTNSIMSVAKFKSCQFRQSSIGLELFAGSIISFDSCVIESNLNTGLWIAKNTESGGRQVSFKTCWFENNATTPTIAQSGSIYVDMTAALATDENPSYLKFENTVISTAGTEPDVTVNRGSSIEFDHCSFSAFDSTRLVFNSGAGYAFAKLKNCGTKTDAPSPTLYASFPDRVLSGGKYLGFAYEYDYQGQTYKNFSGKIAEISATVTQYDVTGVETVVVDTTGGDVSINSLDNGHDGQVINIIKTVSANTLTVEHNAGAGQPIFMPNNASVGLTARQGYQLVCFGDIWYAPLRS